MILVSSLALEILISEFGGGPKAPSFAPSGVVGSECMPATVACPSTSKLASGSELSFFCAQPNQRLKLAAPVRNKSGGRSEARCSRIPFVNIPVRRRSLSAIR